MGEGAVRQGMIENDKPYYSLDYYLKTTFGEKVYKIAINAGMTCPNRDGTIGSGGCIFCSAKGSGDFAGDAAAPIAEQIQQGIKGVEKFHSRRFIAYFQAFTNTYAPLAYLKSVYTQAIEQDAVAVLSIATRPDCVGPEVVGLLSQLRQTYEKPVWVELGLQTVHETTARYIRRGYDLPCFERAVRLLREAGIEVIVHLILGLPGESREQIFETVNYVNSIDVQGVKLHLLHVLRGTDLAEEYQNNRFHVLEEEEYVDLVTACIARFRPDLVLHRLTGDGPKDLLLAPMWSTAKRKVLNHIHRELKAKGIRQGCAYREEGNDVRAGNIV